LVSQCLGIPISFRDGNAEGIDPRWESRLLHTPEPPENPMIVQEEFNYFQTVAATHRVAFYGEGPDAALYYEWQPYLRFLASRHLYGRMTTEVLRHVAAHRRLPLLPTIPRMIRDRGRRSQWSTGYPGWLNDYFQKRLNLRDRWVEKSFEPSSHPLRPVAYAWINGPQWQDLFENLDPASTSAPMEFRHPYFDIRLLRFMIAVPALPWCRRKHLMRQAMQGVLPEPVRTRPKAPLNPNPWAEFSRKQGFQSFVPDTIVHAFVNARAIPHSPPQTLGEFRDAMKPRRLNFWLKSIHAVAN
jgi:asparagine synthase (glutamine-hydrolysing)